MLHVSEHTLGLSILLPWWLEGKAVIAVRGMLWRLAGPSCAAILCCGYLLAECTDGLCCLLGLHKRAKRCSCKDLKERQQQPLAGMVHRLGCQAVLSSLWYWWYRCLSELVLSAKSKGELSISLILV